MVSLTLSNFCGSSAVSPANPDLPFNGTRRFGIDGEDPGKVVYLNDFDNFESNRLSPNNYDSNPILNMEYDNFKWFMLK
jgi:hypothetical protein